MSEPVDPDSEPSAELAALLDALAQPPRADELSDETSVVASMRSVITPAGRTQGAPVSPAQKRVRIAAVATAGLIVVGGAVAAASGRFDPIDRPPTIDGPPTSVPPVELPAAAAGRAQPTIPATTTPPTSATTRETSPDASPTTTGETTESATAVTQDEVVCAEGNHGKTVSSVARTTPPGPEHGPAVVAAAQSDCGKNPTGEPPDEAVERDTGQPADPGPPADTPADTAPGQSGDTGQPADPGPPADTPANTAPGQSGDTGQAADPGPPADTPANGHGPGD